MNKINLAFIAIVAVFSVSNGFTAAAVGYVTPAQISAARTSADHEAIAKAYEAEASVYDKKVEQHKEMARIYQYVNRVNIGMGRHCDRLVTNFENTAQEYRAMAAEHRVMAKAAK